MWYLDGDHQAVSTRQIDPEAAGNWQMLLVAGIRAWGAPLRTNEETYGDEGNNEGYNFCWHPEWQKSISTTFIKVPAYFTLETANV